MTTNTTQSTHPTNNTAQIASWPAWHKNMSSIPTPSVGCFMALFPNLVWQKTTCASPRSGHEASQAPSTVGNGNDFVAESPSTRIGSAVGSFLSVTGLTSETDVCVGPSPFCTSGGEGPNAYSLQENTEGGAPGQGFPVTFYGWVGTGWEQFIYDNTPSSGYVWIEYWLLNYLATNNACPPASQDPPGNPSGDNWFVVGSDCVFNTAVQTTPYEAPTSISSLSLAAYADLDGVDEAQLCVTGGSCYDWTEPATILNLYQQWDLAEFNILGYIDGSQAQFNSGTTITVSNALKDQSGNSIAPVTPCPNDGQTGETNNLNLGSCSSNPSGGQIVFTETNAANKLTFFTNPSVGGSIQVQSPTGTTNVGGTNNAVGESNDILSAQFSVSSPLIVSQLGVYVSSFSSGAAVTLGLYNDNGGGPNAVPTTLIAQTSEVQITASNTWLYGNLQSPAVLQANTLYWIAIETNSVNKVLYYTPYNTPPETACDVSYSTTLPSIYPSCSGGLTSAYFYSSIGAGPLTFTNGQSSSLLPNGDYPITAIPTAGYTFSSWLSSGSASVSSPNTNPTTLIVSSGPGSLTATFFLPPTSITLSASPSSVPAGSTVTLFGAISPNPGAVAVTISLSRDSGNTWVMLMSVMSNGSGAYSTGWTPPTPGSYLLEASWTGNNQLAASQSSPESLTVTGSASPTPTVFLSSPATTPHGQLLTLSVTVFNPTGSTLNANVSLEITGPNNYMLFDVIHVNSNANSQTTSYYDWAVPTQTGSYTIMLAFMPPTLGGVDYEAIQVS